MHKATSRERRNSGRTTSTIVPAVTFCVVRSVMWRSSIFLTADTLRRENTARDHEGTEYSKPSGEGYRGSPQERPETHLTMVRSGRAYAGTRPGGHIDELHRGCAALWAGSLCDARPMRPPPQRTPRPGELVASQASSSTAR